MGLFESLASFCVFIQILLNPKSVTDKCGSSQIVPSLYKTTT